MNNEIKEAYMEDTVGRKIHTPIISKKTGFETFKADNEKYTSEVTTFNLKKPCSWEEFKRQSDETKRTYINLLRCEYGVTDTDIGNFMGLISGTTISKECVRLGIGNGRKGRRYKKQQTQQQYEAWQEFLGHSIKPVEEEIPQPTPQEETPVMAPKLNPNERTDLDDIKSQTILTSPTAPVTYAKFQQRGRLNIFELIGRITSLVPEGEECEIRIEIRK